MDESECLPVVSSIGVVRHTRRHVRDIKCVAVVYGDRTVRTFVHHFITSWAEDIIRSTYYILSP